MSNNKQWEAIDVLSVISFLIGWFNFFENVGQSTMQDAIQDAVMDIHEHLEEQDKKMDAIIEMLGGESQ